MLSHLLNGESIRHLYFLLIFFSCSSCSCVSYFFGSEEKEREITLNVKTAESTNDHAPLYLLIRETDFPHYLMEGYQQIAADVSLPDEEAPPLATLCLFPGTTQTVILKPLENKAIAFYALFTKPGQEWKSILNTRQEYTEVDVVLGEHEIESIHIK